MTNNFDNFHKFGSAKWKDHAVTVRSIKEDNTTSTSLAGVEFNEPVRMEVHGICSAPRGLIKNGRPGYSAFVPVHELQYDTGSNTSNHGSNVEYRTQRAVESKPEHPDPSSNQMVTQQSDKQIREEQARLFKHLEKDNRKKGIETKYQNKDTETFYDDGMPTNHSKNKKKDSKHTSLKDIYMDLEEQNLEGYCDLEVNSLIEIVEKNSGIVRKGVIQCMKEIKETDEVIAGIELEKSHPYGGDGKLKGKQYIFGEKGKLLFVPIKCVRKDKQYESEASGHQNNLRESSQSCRYLGRQERKVSTPVTDHVHVVSPDRISDICGQNKGIQGHYNSCYMDATLCSMYMCNNVFDNYFSRPDTKGDITDHKEIQRILREEIVYPLRKEGYASYDGVMKLRELLDKLSTVEGLTDREKDPEEFLNCLLSETLREEPLLQLSTGQGTFLYQLFVEKDNSISIPTIQHLFEQSFHSSRLKLKEVPSCLILQMPRFGKDYKAYDRIRPTEELDITHVTEGVPRPCCVCGGLAEMECWYCFNEVQKGIESTAFCKICGKKCHQHPQRQKHEIVPIDTSRYKDYTKIPGDGRDINRHCMELTAVLCIERSHYVSFIRCGTRETSKWIFFDSMADRIGERDGYNIPEIQVCPSVKKWLERGKEYNAECMVNRDLDPLERRFFCDAYMCIYTNDDVSKYK